MVAKDDIGGVEEADVDPVTRLTRLGLCFCQALVIVIAVTVVVLRIQAGGTGPDASGNVFLPDFAQFYAVGEFVARGELAEIYKGNNIRSRVRELQQSESGLYFLYPPYAAWPCITFGLVPYDVAVVLYALALVGLAFGLGWIVPRWLFGLSEETSRMASWMFVASIPVLRCVLFGQNGLISLAIVCGALLAAGFVDGRRCERAGGTLFLAGLVASFGLFKPQLFVALWFWLLLFGGRMSVAGMMVGGLMLLGSGLLIGGLESYQTWFDHLTEFRDAAGTVAWRHSLRDAFALVYAVSTETGDSSPAYAAMPTWLRTILPLTLPLWAICSLVPAVFLWTKARSEVQRLTFASLMLGWLLCTPRIFQYDLVLVYPLMLGWWIWVQNEHRQWTELRRWIEYGIFGFVIFTFYISDIAALARIPLLTLIGLAVWIRLIFATIQECLRFRRDSNANPS